jgi:hypothetical protein
VRLRRAASRMPVRAPRRRPPSTRSSASRPHLTADRPRPPRLDATPLPSTPDERSPEFPRPPAEPAGWAAEPTLAEISLPRVPDHWEGGGCDGPEGIRLSSRHVAPQSFLPAPTVSRALGVSCIRGLHRQGRSRSIRTPPRCAVSPHGEEIKRETGDPQEPYSYHPGRIRHGVRRALPVCPLLLRLRDRGRGIPPLGLPPRGAFRV